MTWEPRYEARKAEGVGGPPVPADEPFIIVRAQDKLALAVMDHYMTLYRAVGEAAVFDTDPVLSELHQHRRAIVDWQDTHPTKYADRCGAASLMGEGSMEQPKFRHLQLVRVVGPTDHGDIGRVMRRFTTEDCGHMPPFEHVYEVNVAGRDGVEAHYEHELAVVGEPIAYVVLTSQPDGSWKDDWDGKVHTDRNKAQVALREAKALCGPDRARLANLHWTKGETERG